MESKTVQRRLAHSRRDVVGKPADECRRMRTLDALKPCRELVDRDRRSSWRIVKTRAMARWLIRQRRRCSRLRRRDPARMSAEMQRPPRLSALSCASHQCRRHSSTATTSRDGVNIAARLEALCEPGGCASRVQPMIRSGQVVARLFRLGEQT